MIRCGDKTDIGWGLQGQEGDTPPPEGHRMEGGEGGAVQEKQRKNKRRSLGFGEVTV